MNNSSLTLISHHLCPFVQRAAIILLEKISHFSELTLTFKINQTGFLVYLQREKFHY